MYAYFITGNYCREDDRCLEVCQLDTRLQCLQKVSFCTGLRNPSFVLYDKDRRLLYAVEELNPEGHVCVLRADGFSFELVGRVSSQGADPCHLSLDGQKQFLFAANYSSGSLAVFRLDEDGLPLELSDLVRHTGCGPNKERQEQAHVHFSHWFENRLYVCDLGMDRIFCYALNRENGRLTEMAEESVQMPPGSGPRHLAFREDRPDIIYCVGELDNAIHVLKRANGKFKPVQMLSTLPQDFAGVSKAAAVKISGDGKFLLVSNRGYDSIAVFRSTEDGMLQEKPHIRPVTEFPRDFALFERSVVVGSETRSELHIYQLEDENAELIETGKTYTSVHPVLIEELR